MQRSHPGILAAAEGVLMEESRGRNCTRSSGSTSSSSSDARDEMHAHLESMKTYLGEVSELSSQCEVEHRALHCKVGKA